ncbi:hypothetical protein DIURU_005650 [Diutina rugosa]|uniref:Uncharacterized protein n=1 Tax=Diutina rugosa TaxID=5481 RepID=A0A642UJH5_DIURU|nr:uncharacterized protein DIURU_005650 [Diutina rugosa]KAA8896638.1 hypothetical protein DIURU_005650 [Diutina rugosa]
MKVPEPVRVLFENFPIVTYPPVANEVESATNLERSRQYFFQGAAATDSSFALGCFGVSKIKGRYIPTDPLSLGYAMILASRNKYKLPITADSSDNGSSLMVLSYHSAPTNQLPMLIEDQVQNEVPVRLVKTTKALRKAVTKSLEPKLITVADLIDSYYDLWLLAVAIEQTNFNKTFSIDSECKATETFERRDIYSTLYEWNGFKQRHPTLFTTSHKLTEATKDYFTGTNESALKAYYELILEQYSRDLALFESELSSIQNNLILESKLASLIIIFDELLSESKPAAIQRDHPALIEWASTVLDKY